MHEATTVVPFDSITTLPRKGNTTMAAPLFYRPHYLLRRIARSSTPDLMREMLQGFINQNPLDPSRPSLRRGLRHHV